MNIFILSESAEESARYHCDKHVVKMIVESAQMLSTVHRMLDGSETKSPSKSGKRMVKSWTHPKLDGVLYKAVHINHPCTVWSRESYHNYVWHYKLFYHLCREYEYRYNKVHSTWDKLGKILESLPANIPTTNSMTPFRLAMGSNPECINIHNPIESYRKFYKTKQARFKMDWTNRSIPEWFNE
jgi:hypothetical protein